MRRRIWSAMVAVVGAIALAAATSSPVAAECPFLPPWPSITNAIPSARVVVVGKIITDFDASSLRPLSRRVPDYALRVTHVLRGGARPGDLLDVQNLLPNWPLTRYGMSEAPIASCTYLPVRPGETVAIAFDALRPRGRTSDGAHTWVQPAIRYNALGVLRAVANDQDPAGPWGAREHVTLSQLRTLASLPSTDGVASATSTPSSGSDVLALGIAALLGAMWSLRRTRAPR